jgi:hypothetical protein
MPNYQAAVQTLIHGVPTAPFSILLPPPMGNATKENADYVRQLSAAKYGRPRAEVEQEIEDRYKSTKPAAAAPTAPSSAAAGSPPGAPRGSFLDEWLQKRQNLKPQPQTPQQPPSAPTEPKKPASPDEISVDLR